MALTMKNLLKISMAIRNLGSLSNYTMTKRFIGMSVHSTAHHKNESLVSAQPLLRSDVPQDLLNSSSVEEALKKSTLPAHVFKIVRSNDNAMTAKDTIAALDVLLVLEKNKSQDGAKIYENEGFLTICEILKKKARSLEPHDCVTALKAMIYFRVPTTSVIVQVLLQLLRHSLNHLSLSQLSFLDFLLQKCEKTPLVEALRVALPIVYEINLLTKLDREDIKSIKNALTYLVANTKNPETFNVILHALMTCKQPMDTKIAQNVLWALCELECYPVDLPQVLDHVQNILAENVKSLERRVIMKLLSMITMKIKAREKHYYHERFVDACASTAISEDWGFESAIELLMRLSRIGHTNISLLDYIAGKCFENPTLLKTCSAVFIAELVHGFSAADYKPIFWDTVQADVTTDRVLEELRGRYPLSKLAISLLSLDCFWPKLLERTCENSIGARIYRGPERQRSLLLHQTLLTLYPQYAKTLPLDDTSKLIDATIRIRTFPLAPSLECALGGPGYVLTNVTSKLGHRVDHVLVMRKGGFPVAINDGSNLDGTANDPVRLEDTKLPPDSQVILVLYVHGFGCSINTQRLKGAWLLRIKSLEVATGYSVIPILANMWTSLSESEKVPYLMRAIRLKCDELSLSANS